MEITDPKGGVYGIGDPAYDDDVDFNSITIAIPEAKTPIGKWKYLIKSRVDNQDYSINVLSKPRKTKVPADDGV